MKSSNLVLSAAAIAFISTFAAAAPTNSSQSQSSTNNSTPSVTGQPNQDCGALIESGNGSTPGRSANAPGSAFNPAGVAGTVYAGQQPQNSNNPASVSQYDVACANQPQ